MIEHRFGGDWTKEKLDRLQGYLVAYRSIFATNPRAKYFTTWYVDAFAGTGSISMSPLVANLLDVAADEKSDEERKGFLDGSARIALGLSSPFHKYLFIEASRKRADALTAMVKKDFESLADRATVEAKDANKALRDWCENRAWNKERAVVFLDPYGMQVEWATIELLAATKAVDLWYLFPFATRLLRNDQNIGEIWTKKLNDLFGTPEWYPRFYPTRMRNTLFGDIESTERDATVENIKSFMKVMHSSDRAHSAHRGAIGCYDKMSPCSDRTLR